MSGRRLLDTIAVLNASRSVASKHIALRRRQLDVYTRTSSLAKGVREQADRLAVTAEAASALAKRFNESPSHTGETITKAQDGARTEVPSRQSVEASSASEKGRNGIDEEVFYDQSAKHTARDKVPTGELNVRQEQAERYPLPDGTIPPSDDSFRQGNSSGELFYNKPQFEPAKHPLGRGKKSLNPISSDKSTIPDPSRSRLTPQEAKWLQRQAEFQIPSKVAAPPPESELHVQQDQDIFHKPSPEAPPVLSSLPRVKLPKAAGDVQEGDPHVQEGPINSDVYYVPASTPGKQGQASSTAVDEDELSEEVVNEIFHSPRIARILTGKGGNAAAKNGARRPTPAPLKEKPAEVDSAEKKAEDMIKLGAEFATDASTISKAEQVPYQMLESRVPSSRLGRLWQYGGLATSMAFGAVGEGLRRVTGSNEGSSGSLMFSAGNMERLVTKLSKMRGAALKMGQMMSFQDSKMLPDSIQQVLQRVQDRADYMPASQRDQVLSENLGPDWRDLFESFEEVPMAAASIGQVHGAVLKRTGQKVAVKVQYPGVADSIDSDLNNLSILLTASRILPKGLYLDKTIANARTELAWECDYIREAECGRRFKELLTDEQSVFLVPEIIPEASGKNVLTMERLDGIAVTKIQNFTQEQRDWIGSQILRLCFREICEFRFMQTDPNWTNFLYNAQTNRLELLDFGASREYPAEFINTYMRVLIAASHNDREACRDLSLKLGYLTGFESPTMVDAHVTSILTIAEPFMRSSPDVYDFRDQTITDRVRGLIPVMIRERLAPPPEETYSLHRKLSGAFLLCARLGSRVRCKELFEDVIAKAELGKED